MLLCTSHPSVVYFTGNHRMNSTQLYEWLINEGIDEEDAKILRGNGLNKAFEISHES